MGVISSTMRVLGTELRLSGLGDALPTGTPEAAVVSMSVPSWPVFTPVKFESKGQACSREAHCV